MTPRTKLAVLSIAVACLALPFLGAPATGLGLLALGMAIAVQSTRDAALSNTLALPGSATTIVVAGHDLGITANSNAHCGFELVIEAPALTTGQLADAATVTYVVYHDSVSTFASEASLYGTVLTQTGAASAGAAAVTKRIGLPRGIGRYVRVKATLSTGDCSASSVVTRLEPIVNC